tara:strand:- start:156 stop:740 length:585 start_codon:yes stop_codon:yes gene_type:complete
MGQSKTQYAQLIFPASLKIEDAEAVAGNAITVWDTENHTYTIRFIPTDLNPKHMLYTGVLDEMLDADGKSITKANLGKICYNLGLKIQPRREINPREVHEYFTLHYGDYVETLHPDTKKISLSITGRSEVYKDSAGSKIIVTVKGPPCVSLDAARTALWSKARKLYPPVHWKNDLLVLAIADDINIAYDEDDPQ